MEASLCSRKRRSARDVLLLHQEAKCQSQACKRRYEEEMKRRSAGSCEENRDPGHHQQRNMRAQTLKRETRWFPQSGNRTRTTVRTGSSAVFRLGDEFQSCRPEVRLALIKRTKIQTSVQISVRTVEPRASELVQGFILRDQNDPGSTATESTSEVGSRSTAGPLRTAGVVLDQFSGNRTSRRRSERALGSESCRGEGGAHRIWPRSEGRRTETRRRTKIHPSLFRGRGQLQLSITPKAGQLIIHTFNVRQSYCLRGQTEPILDAWTHHLSNTVHKARGLMGKSQRSCDSYVKLAVTSDLDHRITMKTPTVLNNKNPVYNYRFILYTSDNLILNRLLVSVFNRCSRLIGCMSFGIGSLVSSHKLVTGWFYLLGEEFGQRKHLRVTSQQNKPMSSLEERAAENIPAHCADFRRTPDSTPDTDLNRIATTTATTTNLSNSTTTTAGLKDLPNHSLTFSCPQSLNPTNANYSSCIATLYDSTNQHLATQNSTQRQTVNIIRGKDGFGFTICSDCPVRVQAVDSDSPAHQSGLRQGDSVLQLNGLPVETWKCVDLAHAIRSCPSQIVLVVWRGLPELRSGCETLLHPLKHNKTTGRKLLRHPTHSKHALRQGQGLGVRSSLGALGSLWRDKKEDQEEEEEEEVTEYSSRTTTLKGTRVTSSHGDNYIILSPVNPGEQLLQPVYHDRDTTMGRLYRTHPSRGQNLFHDPRPTSPQRPFTGRTNLPPSSFTSTSSSSASPSDYGNYQNCTIVQSHLPCSSYGTYVTLAPKTLIFPIFVQPLDLCSPDRTLLMAEEMVLHQADLLPAKVPVTVLIYSDLLLFTREDEAGRCNVLQSPLYLNTLQIREVSSEPLHIYFLHSSQSCCRRLFSLEAFSIEQKVRVSLCLHDNIQLQLVATETGHTHRLSDIPSDFSLLSLHQSDLLCHAPHSSSDAPPLCPSSPYSSVCDSVRPPSPSPYSPSTPPPALSSLCPYLSSSSPPSRTLTTTSQPPLPCPPSSSTHMSPVWKERERAEEEEDRRKRRWEEVVEVVEERQQGEGESASETSENVGGVGLLLSPHHFNMKEKEQSGGNEEQEEEEEEGGGTEEFTSTYRPEGLRRSLSEGSLLQEPRSPRFLSDSTIHRLARRTTFNLGLDAMPRPPSIHTLRKQLTREGGSLHHMLLLLNGTKDEELRNPQLTKKTKSLAADVRSRLPFLRRRKNSSCVHGNSLEKALRNNRPSAKEVLKWAESLEVLLTNQYGLVVFRHFLRSEFSEENLDFWLAVESFKKTRPFSNMAAKAVKIYDEFISTNAARQVNVDSAVRESTNQNLCLGVNAASFQLAQDQIFGLMETDSFPRFLRSRLYTQLASQGPTMAVESDK